MLDFSDAEKRAIRSRLDLVVKKHFDDEQVRFIDALWPISPDTAKKWFSKRKLRVPESYALARIAEVCDVSLDWLVLGRGRMDWQRTVARRTARLRLAAEIARRLAREAKRSPEAGYALKALDYLGNVPEVLWRIVVDEVEQLPSIVDLTHKVRR